MTSISPILPGRIPSALIASRLTSNMHRAQRELQRLQDQAATGQKFFLPSDSPTEAVRTIFLQTTIERKEQFAANLQTDKSMLSAAEASLANVSDALNHAKGLLLAGVGDTSTPAEKVALADEIEALIESVVSSGNAKFLGRYMFGGSESAVEPFERLGDTVRYRGDRLNVNSFVDLDLRVANSIDGEAAFAAFTAPAGGDANPAVTLDTKLADLNAGVGVPRGPINVTVDNGGPVTQTVDLTNAETIGDVKTLIENAFAPGTLTVSIIAPPASNGIQVAASAGTVQIADLPLQSTARDLGIAQGPAATITGNDINPQLTLQTPLAAFNNGTGATNANGLQVTNGNLNQTIDISTAVTVEDLFNLLEAENLDLELRINDTGNGLAIASRLSGAAFGIGENGGNDATSLGIRTFVSGTALADLNFGLGVPNQSLDQNGNLLPAEIEITRRDGSTTTVDLAGLNTAQEVIDAITAVDADLTASLNSVGNGISITDTSGTGPLEVHAGEVADALGITGVEPGTNNAIPVAGQDVNLRRSDGVISLLLQLESALRTGNDRELSRLDPLFNNEVDRFSQVRGEIGTRLQLLDTVEGRLADEDVVLQEKLSEQFDADLTDVITRVSTVTSVLQATLQVASSTLNLTLLSFL